MMAGQSRGNASTSTTAETQALRDPILVIRMAPLSHTATSTFAASAFSPKIVVLQLQRLPEVTAISSRQHHCSRQHPPPLGPNPTLTTSSPGQHLVGRLAALVEGGQSITIGASSQLPAMPHDMLLLWANAATLPQSLGSLFYCMRISRHDWHHTGRAASFIMPTAGAASLCGTKEPL